MVEKEAKGPRSIVLIRTVVLGTLLAIAPPALAHPHIFVDAKAAVTFDAEGRLIDIHNTWVFDKEYSAWAVQAMDTNHDGKLSREELQSLANDNIKGLADYHFYTYAGEGSANLNFPVGANATLDDADGRLVLNFDVAPTAPYAILSSLELAVSDPEYYVGITFADAGAIQLVNAPTTCSYAMEKGHPMPDDVARELYALPPDVTKLPPRLEVALRGVQGGVRINCPGGTAGHGTSMAPPATVLDVANEQVQTPQQPSAAPSSNADLFGGWRLPVILGACALLAVSVIGFVVWRVRR